MNKTTFAIFGLITGVALAVAPNVKNIKPAKEEFVATTSVLPTVVVTPEKPLYSASFQIENACPRNNPNYKVEQDNIAYAGLAEGATEYVKHCVKCNIGVYSEHENKDHRTCTFCGERE
jgi:hypothetical protein